MFSKYTVAELGSLVADPSRVQMLTVLLDGLRHSARDLARAADLSPQAATAHLNKLTRGGLIRVTPAGRERLFELDRPEVGHMLEALGAATRTRPSEPLRLARTCYDHLAGHVAVLLTRAWLERGVLLRRDQRLELTPRGERWFMDQRIDPAALQRQRRTLIRGCLDWTEREPHLAGALGAAWLTHCFASGWLRRMPGTRAVRVSDTGRRAFRELLGVELAAAQRVPSRPAHSPDWMKLAQ